MTVLELRFPAGRYHATPWGRHVNEGAVEWPPSPWRIIRALIATWHLKARKDDEIPEAVIRALTNALSQPPSFHLPPATTGHTRHYMPFNEGKNEKTTKVFDTFIQLSERDAILVAWNVTLSPEQLTALKILAERLGYFGRAEGLVFASVLEGVSAIEPNARPLEENAPLSPKQELVRLLAPMTPEDYNTWLNGYLTANKPPTETKKKAAKKPKDIEVPPDLFGALHADTGELQAAGWNLPPGARHINYARPENAFTPVRKPRQPKTSLPTVARYAIASTVAPSITQAVSVADRLHKALCRWSDQGAGKSAVFTGLDAEGKPRTGHSHAHIFCEANGPRDAITHITVWAEMGFDESACLALRQLNKVWGRNDHDVHLILHGIGQPADFQDCSLLREAKVWRSLTPFVATRHAKTFRDGRPKIDPDNGWQIGSPGHDLLRLLSRQANCTGAQIKHLTEREQPYAFGERRLRSLQFQTVRHDGDGSHGHQSGNAFTITFPEARRGPFAFGYGSHFGLGLFVPVMD